MFKCVQNQVPKVGREPKGSAQTSAAGACAATSIAPINILAEHRRLAEELAAIRASTAWAVAGRLSGLRQRLLPEGSRRHQCFRLGMRGLRLWRREGLAAVLQRIFGKRTCRIIGLSKPVVEDFLPQRADTLTYRPDCTGAGSAPSANRFRVVFIGPGASCEIPSLRYRAHNVIEALALSGGEGSFVALEEVQSNFSTILSHDLIVLVRLMLNPLIAKVIECARKIGLPIVYDIDDYLFETWVMPYVEAFRALPKPQPLRILHELGACLQECDYFTGSTSYLAEKAAALGKKSFVLHNGLNARQLQLAHQALEERSVCSRNEIIRVGYFSGTRTHQADFRVVYPALMALLREQSKARLLIVGDLDLGDFPGLAPYVEQLETLPFLPWSELPAAIAKVDINLIPLELTPFNEGKSNLKYFEAGLLKVPSIASPTQINRESITHGHNGLLARTPEEWYDSLKDLMSSSDRRERMGQRAYEHVLQNYAPQATAREAVEVYRQIIQNHRSRGEYSEHAPLGSPRQTFVLGRQAG